MVKHRVGAGILLGSLLFAAPATASVMHVIQAGETLSGIAAVNGQSTEALAAYNGISAETYVIAGETIQIPAVGEVPATGTTTPTSTATATTTPMAPVGLDPNAAASWNAMAAAALEQYGVSLQSAGPLSGGRTYEQQAYLYEQYLAGTGAPANPPGTSTHELGIAVDVATPEMRSVIDAIGAAYGWYGTIPSEWWHVQWSY